MNSEIKIGLLHGIALGYIFYEPSQEYDVEDFEDYFEVHQFCVIFFFINIVVWRDQY